MLYVELILIGVSLSIDAFSLALSVGLNNGISNKKNIYPLTVGVFHFFMPMLGYILKMFINKVIVIPNKLIFIIVLIFILIGIILDKENNNVFINPFLFAFSVSLDSFTIGISLEKSYLIISSIIFSVISYIFTYVGFKVSHKMIEKYQNKSKIISIIILLAILIYNLI